jgi:4-hydroxy-tetrahydrodipicolinate synthase
MKNNTIPDGVYPTMITPYHEDGRIDWDALEALSNGISSEAWRDTSPSVSRAKCSFGLRERLELARMSIRFAGGRVPVSCRGMSPIPSTIKSKKLR